SAPSLRHRQTEISDKKGFPNRFRVLAALPRNPVLRQNLIPLVDDGRCSLATGSGTFKEAVDRRGGQQVGSVGPPQGRRRALWGWGGEEPDGRTGPIVAIRSSWALSRSSHFVGPARRFALRNPAAAGRRRNRALWGRCLECAPAH